jgi:hypothetical protein
MSRVQRFILGSRENIAGTVYGTIIVMGALAAGAEGSAGDIRPWELAVFVAATVIVLWIAHVYAHALGETIRLGRRLDAAELASVARREFAIPLAAVLPLTALILGAIGVFRESTAVWIALGFGIATLVVDGFRYAAVDRLGRVGTAVTVTINLTLGLLIVGLKALLGH